MLTVNSHTFVTLEEKRSIFIAHLLPYSIFEETLKELKKEHPKARHFVYAYRYIDKQERIVERSSDDGEPKGTSGAPTLKVLIGHNLINCAIITVRYFGGTLLGAGGLVRAYSNSANLAVKNGDLIEYVKLETKAIEIPFELSSKAEYLAKNLDVEIVKREFKQEGIRLVCRGRLEDLSNMDKKLNFL